MNIINTSLLALMVYSGLDRKITANSLIFAVLLISEGNYTNEKILGYWIFYLVSVVVSYFMDDVAG